jgi:hypothetical protein
VTPLINSRKEIVMTKFATLALTVLLSSCSSSSQGTSPPDQPPSPYVDGFNPAPAEAGYTRYVLPPIRNIAPGTDRMWCQYIEAPATDSDYDIVWVQGAQSKGGHHIVLYSTAAQVPGGTTRDCTDNDMLSVRFLGGLGGEATSSIGKVLPSGTVFRMPKGSRYMANVHYINASDHPIDGQGVVDIKIVPPDFSKKVASIFTSVGVDSLKVPPGPSSMDVKCNIKQDLTVLIFGNHMHELGTAAYSEVTRKDGTKQTLRQDRTWDKNEVFNPLFDTWTLDKPLLFHTGDVLTTHCEWNNTTNAAVSFPTEMCVSFGFYLGDTQIDCVDNDWSDNRQ